MRLVFTANGWTDYRHRVENDRTMLRRVTPLIEATLRDPSTRIGKPELLRGNFAGYWSRRIDEEHRLVYMLDGDDVVVIGARHHY